MENMMIFSSADVSVPKVRRAAKAGKIGACINFIGDYSRENWMFDVGSIHYQGWFYQGTTGTDLSAAYGRNVRSSVRKGGTCWLPGGAGAMGQMHTQLAVDSEDGPARILVTDMDKTRIAHVKEQLGPIAEKRGIEFKLMNPADFASPQEFDDAVTAFAPEGFDDIIMLVPVPALVSGSAKHLGKDRADEHLCRNSRGQGGGASDCRNRRKRFPFHRFKRKPHRGSAPYDPSCGGGDFESCFRAGGDRRHEGSERGT